MLEMDLYEALESLYENAKYIQSIAPKEDGNTHIGKIIKKSEEIVNIYEDYIINSFDNEIKESDINNE